MDSAIEFERDIERYLKSKLPYIPEHTTMEIVAYVTNQTSIFIMDMVQELSRSTRSHRSPNKVSYRYYSDRVSESDD